MLFCLIVAVCFFFLFKPIGKLLAYILTLFLLTFAVGAIDYCLLDDVWWSQWILSPLLFCVGFGLVYLRIVNTMAGRMTAVEESSKPRLDELFGRYQYRDKQVEAFVSKFVDANSTPSDMIYAITAHDAYFLEGEGSGPFLLCEAYIHASQGNYSRATDVATELCKRMKVNTKDDVLFDWITADPQICEKLFSPDGKFKFSV